MQHLANFPGLHTVHSTSVDLQMNSAIWVHCNAERYAGRLLAFWLFNRQKWSSIILACSCVKLHSDGGFKVTGVAVLAGYGP